MTGSFAQTCNRLSQFLKKGGSFGDINIFEPFFNSVKPSSTSAQMTIFYCGQVIVLDGFPSDKAMEIMDAAKLASSSTFNQPEPAAGLSSDLPIARKASLRRFLEKRKERVATRVPYQMNKLAGLEESRYSWIDLEAQPLKHNLELRL